MLRNTTDSFQLCLMPDSAFVSQFSGLLLKCRAKHLKGFGFPVSRLLGKSCLFSQPRSRRSTWKASQHCGNFHLDLAKCLLAHHNKLLSRLRPMNFTVFSDPDLSF